MKLTDLREEIDGLNRELVELLGKRTEVARKIARIKKEGDLPILDAAREEKIKEEMRSLAKKSRISASFIDDVFHLLLEYTRLEMEMEAVK